MENRNQHHTHPTRRGVLRGSLAGALAAVGLAGKETLVVASNLVEQDTPGVTEGPYWVDELLNRSDVRTDTNSGVAQAGLPLYLAVNVSELSADGTVTPLVGAFVDIWHCNSAGLYSDESSENTVGANYLRGYQVTNAHGNVKFTSIYPGWYSGRTPHVHARVRVYDATTDTVTYNFTTQFFFDDQITSDVYQNVSPYTSRPNRDTTNATDGIYTGASNDGTVAENAGEYLMLRLSENRTKAVASFNIVIDLSNTANEDTGMGAGGGGGTPPTGGDGGTPPTGGGGGTPPTGGGPGGPPPGGGGGGMGGGGMSSNFEPERPQTQVVASNANRVLKNPANLHRA